MANEADGLHAPKRLFLNQGGYRGERITVHHVLSQLGEAAIEAGWDVDEVIRAEEYPVWRFARNRLPRERIRLRVYISAGIHGDEPAGPLAAMRLLSNNHWPEDVHITLFPCLNPVGLARNSREGPEGLDLNRDYRHARTALVQAHLRWFQDQPEFDLALMLHEDWEADGFYLYELARDGLGPIASEVIASVSRVCPILQASRADDWPATNGVVRPDIDPNDRPEWPEALYVFMHKADQCCTFEAPSDYPLPTRVAALVTAAQRAVDSAVRRR